MYSEFLNAKYGTDSPGSDRFEKTVGKYHASQISNCERKLYWQFNKGSEPDESSYKYFELGRLHEANFGAALAWKYGDFTPKDVGRLTNEELVEATDRVAQDVMIRVEFDDFVLTGESDWVVFEEDADPVELVVVNGDRTAFVDDEEVGYDGNIQRVFETKTTKSIDWKLQHGEDKSHRYQIYAYMHAFDSPGTIAYVERDTIAECLVPIEYREEEWLDCELRLTRHHQNLQYGGLPETTPLTDGECKFCDFREECRIEGGKVWG